MNEAIEFLKQKLSELINYIPNIQCDYFYSEYDATHVIKICPQDIFSDDKQYIEQEKKIIKKFIEKFPYESIVFIGKDGNELLEGSEHIETFKGKQYEEEQVLVNIYCTTIIPKEPTIKNEVLNKNVIDYTFSLKYVDIKTITKIDYSINYSVDYSKNYLNSSVIDDQDNCLLAA